MNALLAAVRAVHYASAMLLFGELVFALVVRAGPAGARRSPALGADDERARRRLPRSRAGASREHRVRRRVARRLPRRR